MYLRCRILFDMREIMIFTHIFSAIYFFVREVMLAKGEDESNESATDMKT